MAFRLGQKIEAVDQTGRRKRIGVAAVAITDDFDNLSLVTSRDLAEFSNDFRYVNEAGHQEKIGTNREFLFYEEENSRHPADLIAKIEPNNFIDPQSGNLELYPSIDRDALAGLDIRIPTFQGILEGFIANSTYTIKYQPSSGPVNNVPGSLRLKFYSPPHPDQLTGISGISVHSDKGALIGIVTGCLDNGDLLAVAADDILERSASRLASMTDIERFNMQLEEEKENISKNLDIDQFLLLFDHQLVAIQTQINNPGEMNQSLYQTCQLIDSMATGFDREILGITRSRANAALVGNALAINVLDDAIENTSERYQHLMLGEI